MPSSSNAWTEIRSPTHGSIFDLDKAEIVAALRAQRTRTMTLLRGIPEADWERIVVPRWRLHEVAAHLLTTDEGALTGRSLMTGLTSDANAAISKVEEWNDRQVLRWSNRPIPEILAGMEKWARRMETVARVVPAPIARPRIVTPFGKVSLLWLASLRVYDEWIHLEDIRRAYGMPSDDAPASIRPVARQLIAGLPIQSCSRVADGASGCVALAFSDVDYPPVGYDLAARTYGYGVEGSDARVTGVTSAVAMVAARRDAWRESEASGALKVEGDRTAAEAFLDALQLV